MFTKHYKHGTVNNQGETTPNNSTDAIAFHLELYPLTQTGETILKALGGSHENPTVNIWRWSNSKKAKKEQAQKLTNIINLLSQ